LKLALIGLKDSAFMVRMQSCIMLAYSQREDMIPYLQELLSHKDKKTSRHAEMAIGHIKAKTVFYQCWDV
jgi:HEAT repeat protein